MKRTTDEINSSSEKLEEVTAPTLRTAYNRRKTLIEKRMKSACRAFLLSALIACGLSTAEAYEDLLWLEE